MSSIRNMLKDKLFFSTLITIAIPITLQNLIASSVNMLDTFMISSLGEKSLAAVGLANQVFFFYSLIIFGIASGSAIFIAQFWGKMDEKNIKRVLGLALFTSIIVGLIFTVAVLIAPDSIMRIFSSDNEVIKLGADYLVIVIFSYIVFGAGFTFQISSRSTGNAKMPMVASIISFFVNLVFNYILIYGHLSFPRLEVKGAAYATLLARVVELLLVVYAIYSSEGPLKGTIKEFTDWNRDFVYKYFKTSSPVIINETFWSLGNVLYSIAYAKIGTEAAAAIQILSVVQNLFMVFTRGVGNACTVMVGNKIGADEEDTAIEYANRFLFISAVLGLLLGLILIFTSDLILMFFRDLSPQLRHTSKMLLIILGIFFAVKTVNGTIIVGILRSGGDTRFSMLLEMGSVWLAGVPLAFIGSMVLKLPVYLVTPLAYSEEIVKILIGLFRVHSKKWVVNVTRGM
mgnify:CR=1 FL=1